jgi:hypothetical protein
VPVIGEVVKSALGRGLDSHVGLELAPCHFKKIEG